MNPVSFNCSWCSQVFPSCYDLDAHLRAHGFGDVGGVLPPPTPQIFPSVDRNEVNQPFLTFSIERSKVNDPDTMGLTMEEILWGQNRNSRSHPYLKPTNKAEEPLCAETVDDNFTTLDLLREWVPIRGLEGHDFDAGSSSNRNSRFHPYLKPTNKAEEPVCVETVDDNFATLDLLREWVPIRGLEGHGFDAGSSSSCPISNASTSPEIDLKNLNGGQKLDLDLKLGF